MNLRVTVAGKVKGHVKRPDTINKHFETEAIATSKNITQEDIDNISGFNLAPLQAGQ